MRHILMKSKSTIKQSQKIPSLSVRFSSASAEWATPKWLFEILNKEFGFTLEVCSAHENAKCRRHFTCAENGLKMSWVGEVCWMNPPYGSTIKYWMVNAYDASSHFGATVVCLVPSRSDTAWWHHFAMKHEIRLLKGRLKFGDGTGSAPFPSAIVVMRPSSFKLCGFADNHSGVKNF